MIAITGASGFIGRRLVPLLLDSGYAVRALVRTPPDERLWGDAQPTQIIGTLEDTAALSRLVDGADVVVHLAGLIKARTRADFEAVNCDGTTRLVDQLQNKACDAHLIHVSTLAAREPQLSDYAASKQAGEEIVRQRFGDRTTILRPSATYGPGDRETLVFFQMASRRLVPIPAPAEARAAVIHVDDLCRLIAELLHEKPDPAIRLAADARPEGYSWREILQTAAQTVGNPRARLFQAPASLLRTVAASGDLANRMGEVNMLTSQKLKELRHPDWSVPRAQWAQPANWQPQYDLVSGFADAVGWYRQQGWLPPR